MQLEETPKRRAGGSLSAMMMIAVLVASTYGAVLLVISFSGICAHDVDIDPLRPYSALGAFTTAGFSIRRLGKIVAMDGGGLTYRDTWRSTRIPMSNVRAVFATTGKGGILLVVRSRSGAVIRIGEEFGRSERESFAKELGARLAGHRVRIKEVPWNEYWPLLREFERSPEESPRSPWYILVFAGIGSLVAFCMFVTILFVESGYIIGAPFMVALAVPFILMAAYMYSRRGRLFTAGLIWLGFMSILFGAFSLLATQIGFDSNVKVSGWPAYFIAILAGLFVILVGRWEKREEGELRLEIEKKCNDVR